jgi:hypothetical protein
MNMLACLSIPLLIVMEEVNVGGAHMGHVAEVEAVDGTTAWEKWWIVELNMTIFSKCWSPVQSKTLILC